MRERQSARVQSSIKNGTITVTISHPLNKTMYNLPLTLKTYLPANWKNAAITQGNTSKTTRVAVDAGGTYVLYQAYPNSTPVILTSR